MSIEHNFTEHYYSEKMVNFVNIKFITELGMIINANSRTKRGQTWDDDTEA